MLKLPRLGLGTWQSAKGEVRAAVCEAIRVGYRLIDCALAYGNEAEVGEGIADAVGKGLCKRDELFVISKIWNSMHSASGVAKAVSQSLASLKLDYIDAMLIHWPMGYEEGGELFPKNADGSFRYSDVNYMETWRALESFVESGKLKSIGLSNFNSMQIARVLNEGRIKPAVVQVECHIYHQQKKLRHFCHEHDIAFIGYSPFCSPMLPPHLAPPAGVPKPFEDDVIKGIAKQHSKSPAQVILRWFVQHSVIPIPKSVNPARIAANFDVGFELSDGEMSQLDGLDKRLRLINLTHISSHPFWPFNEEF